MAAGRQLTPSAAARLVTKAGSGRIWDGPFTNTKEQLGGS
jgi:hypothetical protein